MPTVSRYQALRQRSFARHLDLFLTASCATGLLEQVTPLLYLTFCPTPADWALYLRWHQAKRMEEDWANGYTVRQLDEALKTWKHSTDVTPYRRVHDETHCLQLDEFLALFAHPVEKLTCAYCHLTQAESKRLQRAGQLQTKRLRTRGTSFEMDCREPYLGYSVGNVAVCCYWCNNAKTDEFTKKEFAPVARTLEQVWRERLAKC